MGFWDRAEQFLLDLQRDPERAARYFQYAYWLSVLVVLLGFVVIMVRLREEGFL